METLTHTVCVDVDPELARVAAFALERGTVTTADIADVQRQYRRVNPAGHWFDPGAMRFFRSRLATSAYVGPGGIFFVSSEQFVDGRGIAAPRAYSVRSFDPLTGDVDTVGEFQAHASRRTADRLARQYAEKGAPCASPS